MANIEEMKSINITTFNKVDHRIEALRLAVSLHDRIPIGENVDQKARDCLSDSIIQLSERFLEHLRNKHG